MSQIFVGVFRESYGWIAPDMSMSGLEDEFRLATARGMDRLLYVFEPSSGREPRLQTLVEEAKNSGITLTSYSDPEQLRNRVRNDLTAVISQRFADQAVFSNDGPTATEVLRSIVPTAGHRLRRPVVERRLIDSLTQVDRLVVTAPLGCGKTMLLAQMSEEHQWVFVDAQGLNRLDSLARAVNAIRARLGRPALTLTSEAAAIKELLTDSQSLPDLTLAVDGALEPLLFWTSFPVGRRLVVTSRTSLGVPSDQRFDVPLLSEQEIANWVATLRGAVPTAAELAALVHRSGGNPLYLRFFALGQDTSADMSLQELEIRAVQSLPPRAREITSYMALSARPFSMADLVDLLGTDDGPEAVADEISRASGVLRHIRGHLTLIHEHLRTTLLDQLRQAPTRLGFFASRLGRHFEDSDRFLAAFEAYSAAGEAGGMDRVLDRAGYEAALQGVGAPAIPVFRRQVIVAAEKGNRDRQLDALLGLAFALKQTGDKHQAGQSLSEARAIAEGATDPSLLLRVTEMDAVLDVDNRPRGERIARLEALRNLYSEKQDVFNSARTGTLLTAEYIFSSDYRKAEVVCREVLAAFEQLGDEYGIRVARLNLAAALSGIGGRQEEAAAIARDLQEQLDPDEYPRERAVLCNYLARHYREADDPERASEFAREAISIGEYLDDRSVIAINRITLGNTHRDQEHLDDALVEYHIADRIAATASLRDTESAANELIASVHNEREHYQLALQHAEHAANLAREIGDEILIARAEEERAIAFKGQRDIDLAVAAFAAGAKAIGRIRPGGSFLVSMVNDGLETCMSAGRIDLKIRLLDEVFGDDLRTRQHEAHPLRTLYHVLPRIASSITRVDRTLPLVALSVADLLAGAPPQIERRVVLQAINALLDQVGSTTKRSTLSALAAVLLAHSGGPLTLSDLASVCERIARKSRSLYFKPRFDGAGHWTVRLDVADGVVVSVFQLDDSPKTASTTAVLALLLASVDDLIRERLLEGDRLPRNEVIINVASRQEFEKEIGGDVLKLGDVPKGFSVVESTDVSRTDQPPMLVLCEADFPIPWRPNEHAMSDMHLLLAEVLRVLVRHLLAQSIESDVLFPKIVKIIRRISYGGPTSHLHPRP